MHSTDSMDLALALLVFNKVANPYLLTGWKPTRSDPLYAYEWPQGESHLLVASIRAEDEILRLLEANQSITTERLINPKASHDFNDDVVTTALHAKGMFTTQPILILTGTTPELAWSLRITAADRAKFSSLIDQYGFELVGSQVFVRPPIAHDLSPKFARISQDFAVHSDNAISYRGRRVVLTGQQSRVAAAIMLASLYGSRVTSDAIAQLVGRAQATKVVSELRQSFWNVTGQLDHEYFDNLKGIGYTFKQ